MLPTRGPQRRDPAPLRPQHHRAAVHPEQARHLSRREQVVVDRKSTRLNSSHPSISYAVFCLKKKNGRPPYTASSDPGHPLSSFLVTLFVVLLRRRSCGLVSACVWLVCISSFTFVRCSRQHAR